MRVILDEDVPLPAATKRLALAIAGIVAAMPEIVEELEGVRGQRLVSIISPSPSGRRYDMVDPRRDPPPYWR